MAVLRKDNISRGAHNMAGDGRVPDGYVRDMVNFDPRQGGSATLRAGYELVAPGTNVRLAVALPNYVIFVDGADVKAFDRRTASTQVVGAVHPVAPVTGVVFNNRVYMTTTAGNISTDGGPVKPWGVPAPEFDLEVVPGSLPPGVYKVAVVATGPDGEESGVDPIVVRLVEGRQVKLTSADPRLLRVYASVANGSTLFYQGVLVGGGMAISTVDDHTERLATEGLRPFPPCEQLVAHRGVIVGAYDNQLVYTVPLIPHLFDPLARFYQYPAAIKVLASTHGGVYVVADKTYFLTDLESNQPEQRVALDMDAVEGSATPLPDGRVAWFTRYGLAIGDSSGNVTLPNRDTYAPEVAQRGASGALEYNGSLMVVTASRGATGPNNLTAGDFADLETSDGR